MYGIRKSSYVASVGNTYKRLFPSGFGMWLPFRNYQRPVLYFELDVTSVHVPSDKNVRPNRAGRFI